MPLLVTSVPNLVQGVSQQPDNLRYPGQSDEQINAWSTVVEGLVKRPNTDYVKSITPTDDSDLFTHFVKRDETNKYAVTVGESGGTVQVKATNLETGADIPVSTTSIATSYLSGITTPRTDLTALTVADYTFLVNKNKVVAKSTEESNYSRLPPKEGLIVVKLGDYEKNYSVFINDTLVPYDSTVTLLAPSTHTDPSPSSATYRSDKSSTSGFAADTTKIANDLKELIDAYIAVNSTATTQSVQNVNITGGFGLPYAPLIDAGAVSPTVINADVYKIEFTLTQGTTGTGAKGYILTNTDGSIASAELTNQGTGYDASLTTTLEIQIYKGRWVFSPTIGTNWFGWSLFQTVTSSNASNFGYTFPTLGTVVIPNVAGATYEVDVKESIIRLKSVRYVQHNTTFYSLIKDHTATSDSEPGVGSDWTEYWQEAPASITNAQAWVNSAVYKLSDFSIRTSDGLSDQGLGAIYKEVNSITELPAVCYNNFKVKIVGDADIDQDDYYVAFKTKDGMDFGEGSWIETVGWWNDGASASDVEALKNAFDPSTMPITLKPVFTGNTVTSFKLQSPNEDSTDAPKWSQRAAGDNLTNPFPSFTNKTINDVFFFKNRLGFLTDSNVIFSEADQYFNFFRTTTQQLLDSAPIDVGLSHTKVAILQHAIPFQEKLMLFSKQSQFVLRGAEILSPKTVAISPVTEYDISDNIEPIALGNYIYFPFKRQSFEGLYEYYVDNNTEVFEATEITAQAPKYIPSDITHLVGTASENMVICKSSTEARSLYVYKYYWQNKEKIQSAWMKFTYSRDIRGFDFIDSDLYLITSDSTGLHLEKATMETGQTDTGLTYKLLLDSRLDSAETTLYTLTATYDAASKTTTISGFPYDPANVVIYTKGGNYKEFTKTTDEAGTVSGDLSSTPFFAGIPYDMLYRFSNQILKQPTERGGRSSSDYTFQTIRNASIEYADTGHFTVEVTPRFRDTYTYAYNPTLLASLSTLDSFTPESGHFRFAVQAQPNEATIEVKSDSALPCKLLAAEFESMIIPRAKRYGS